MKRFVFCALAASLMLAGASAAQAHIPSECAAHVQELQWALEGQEAAREHVEASHNIVVTQTEESGEASHRFRPALIEQYIRMDKQVRRKALALIGCIVERSTLSLLDE